MIPAPATLPTQLRGQFEELAPKLEEMGTLRETDAQMLARYLLLDWEYTATVPQVVQSIQEGDLTQAERWSSVQDKLHRQLNDLAAQLGLTAESRKKNGWILPR